MPNGEEDAFRILPTLTIDKDCTLWKHICQLYETIWNHMISYEMMGIIDKARLQLRCRTRWPAPDGQLLIIHTLFARSAPTAVAPTTGRMKRRTTKANWPLSASFVLLSLFAFVSLCLYLSSPSSQIYLSPAVFQRASASFYSVINGQSLFKLYWRTLEQSSMICEPYLIWANS